MKRFALASMVALLTISAIGHLIPSAPSQKKPAAERAEASKFRVTDDKLGRSVTFQAIDTSAVGALSIACKSGKPDSFMIKLDREPSSPPPLQGVYGYFNFDREPKLKVELGYLMNGYWAFRNDESADIKQILAQFYEGKNLTFTPPDALDLGDPVTWSGPRGLDKNSCDL